MSEALRTILPDLIDPLLELVRHSTEVADPPPRTSLTNLEFMLTTMLDYPSMPIDKTQRWLGFVQGVLAARGLLDVDAERDRTRPIFHAYYRKIGIQPPDSMSSG